MSHAHGVFGTALGCMDGRVIPQVDAFLKEKYHVDFVDQPTEPGPEKYIAEGDEAAIMSIKKKVEISVNGHGSRIVAIVAHQGCAGSPVSHEEHFSYMKTAMERVKSWGLPVQVVGVWVTIDPETNEARAQEFSESLEITPFTAA